MSPIMFYLHIVPSLPVRRLKFCFVFIFVKSENSHIFLGSYTRKIPSRYFENRKCKLTYSGE